MVGSFLNGKFGSLDQVHPFLVSLLFAGDRFESRPLLTAALARCDVVVLDRYVASNVAHQAAKLTGNERETLRGSIEHVEFDLFEMPRPDRVLLLDVTVPVAQKLVAKKGARNYTERAADIQEADANYLGRVREMYLQLAAREPNWSVIGCEGTDGLRTVDDVADEIGGSSSRLPYRSTRRVDGGSNPVNGRKSLFPRRVKCAVSRFHQEPAEDADQDQENPVFRRRHVRPLVRKKRAIERVVRADREENVAHGTFRRKGASWNPTAEFPAKSSS